MLQSESERAAVRDELRISEERLRVESGAEIARVRHHLRGQGGGFRDQVSHWARARRRRSRGGMSLLPDSLSKGHSKASDYACVWNILYHDNRRVLDVAADRDGGVVDSVMEGSNVRGTLSAIPNELGSTLT